MQRIRMVRRLVIPVVLVSLAAVAALDGSLSARAAATSAADVAAPSAPFTPYATVNGIVATSPSNAWVAGQSFIGGSMLIAHWNGSGWSRETSLESPGSFSAISMDSRSDLWAVGSLNAGASLVAHWNGKTWTTDTSVPKVQGQLNGVVAVDGDVWISGFSEPDYTPLMLHRTRGHWYVVPTPAPASGSLRVSFAALSRTNIWATTISDAGQSYLLHWNGSAWKTAAVPQWATKDYLSGLAPGPHGGVWAVGSDAATNTAPLSMYWNGKYWIHYAVPAVKASQLDGVTSIPGGTAWAVGYYWKTTTASGFAVPLILHWSGKAWTVVKSPEIGSPPYSWGGLSAVTATSPSNAWALGWECANRCEGPRFSVLLHWNGKTWS